MMEEKSGMDISLQPMTRERMHELYRGFTFDPSIFAESLVKNARSQHILEKLGFRYLGEEEGFKQYRLEKKDWESAE